MPSKLYVSNLGPAATLAGMRELFGTCGNVLEVEFAAERGSRSFPSAAYITMATPTAADKAVNDLHGRLHGDRVLIVSRMSQDTRPSPDADARTSRRSSPDDVQVKLTQQYRDRGGMTYELSCSGKLLTLRFVFPVKDEDDWQLEARLTPGTTVPVTASAMTRERALRTLIDACASSGDPLASADVDWEAVAGALRAVRAL